MSFLKLNLGCGRNILPGYVNIDWAKLPGVDVVANLDDCANTALTLDDDSADTFLLSHVIEHIRNPLPLMQELWRIATPGAQLEIRVPHGASDDAWEDPTHVRAMFPGSFGYYSQPYYWRADYGYRGDWLTESVTMFVSREKFGNMPLANIYEIIATQRNVVVEMVATLKAIKPLRKPLRELQNNFGLYIGFA